MQIQKIKNQQIKVITLNQEHIEHLSNFVTQYYMSIKNLEEKDRYKIYPRIRCSLIPAARLGWSYILKRRQEILTVSVCLDLLEYLQLSEIIQSEHMFLDYGQTCLQFIQKLKTLTPKKGQYLFNIFTIINFNNFRKTFNFLKMCLVICKAGGWKKYLIKSTNPIPFLKIGAKIIQQSSQRQHQQKMYLIQINLKNMVFNIDPFRQINPKF